MAISKATKTAIIATYSNNQPQNTGLVEVQVALLTAEIKALTAHMVVHKKDFISKRGLYMKVSQRKKLLNYLKNKDITRYRNLLQSLELRGN